MNPARRRTVEESHRITPGDHPRCAEQGCDATGSECDKKDERHRKSRPCVDHVSDQSRLGITCPRPGEIALTSVRKATQRPGTIPSRGTTSDLLGSSRGPTRVTLAQCVILPLRGVAQWPCVEGAGADWPPFNAAKSRDRGQPQLLEMSPMPERSIPEPPLSSLGQGISL